MVIIPGVEVDDGRLADICDRYGIAELQIFGSQARGTAGPDSDIDVLYTLRPGRRLGWEIEQVADDPTEASRLTAHDLREPRDLLGRQAPNGQDLAEALQRRQRRAQLVRRVGDQLPLRPRFPVSRKLNVQPRTPSIAPCRCWRFCSAMGV